MFPLDESLHVASMAHSYKSVTRTVIEFRRSYVMVTITIHHRPLAEPLIAR